ncbi:MAG: helix-turn-helix domain-containing protein [Clostridia bacterium]|nr:helix-turn-helix domain-containing protein [Clostridia bacterium]
MSYNLNQVAMFTGLTTRTLRNHLKLGVLKGEKIDGNWCFTAEDVEAYLKEPTIQQSISAKQHAIIYDFLTDAFKKENRICTIMDFPVSVEEAMDISKFFCEIISEFGCDVEFRFINERNFARFILAGSEEQVSTFMKAYYER